MWVSLFSPISMAVGRAEAVVAAWSGSAAGASAELRGCTRVSQVELASPLSLLSLLSLSVDSSGDGEVCEKHSLRLVGTTRTGGTYHLGKLPAIHERDEWQLPAPAQHVALCTSTTVGEGGSLCNTHTHAGIHVTMVKHTQRRL